tara:strand:+ start:701 stop:883 length:183 start_codon:yes stop_codon:yes gene_type:complete
VDLKRYQQPRPAQQNESVFTDERTGRKVYNNYTGVLGKMEKPFSNMPIIKKRMYLKGTKA